MEGSSCCAKPDDNKCVSSTLAILRVLAITLHLGKPKSQRAHPLGLCTAHGR